MGDGGHVFDHRDFQSGGLQGTDCGFTAGTGALNVNLNGLQAMLHSGLGSGLSSRLSSEGSGLAGTAEAQLTGRSPRQSITLQIGDGDDDNSWLDELALKEAIRNLNDREKRILNLRFFKGMTQIEVSSEIGISQAQVSRLEKGALDRIKKQL